MKYLVLVGLNYPDGSGGEKRAEPGEVVEDIPEKLAKALERDGVITTDLKAKWQKIAPRNPVIDETGETPDEEAS